ncbi:MAG: MEDS domain-containing protein [bacterium]
MKINDLEIKSLADIEPGHHVCCIYLSEKEHKALLTPFLHQGLEKNEKVIYIADERTAQVILEYLKDDGLDYHLYIKKGQLQILSANDSYIKEGIFDPDSMISLLQHETELSLLMGYRALRVTGEMSWALKGIPGSHRLIEYESKLNSFFPGSKCLALCQYDRRVFGAELLLKVLSTHPIIFIGTEAFDNFYYIPPEKFLCQDISATMFDIELKNLQQYKKAVDASKKSQDELEQEVASRTTELSLAVKKLQKEVERRAQTEDKLREAKISYKIIADFNYDWEYWLSPDGEIKYISPSCKRITGYTCEDFLRDPGLINKIILPEDKDIWDQHVNAVLNERKMLEVQFRIKRKDGEISWIEHACHPVIEDSLNFLGFRASNRDITKRKNTEVALRESESNLKRALEVAHMGSWHLDIEKDDLYWSEGVYEIFGVSPDLNLNYLKFLEIIHPEDRDLVDTKWKEAITKKSFDQQSYDIEHRIIVEGRVRWLREKVEIEFNKKGEAIRAIGIVQDITDRKTAEEDVHRLKNELMHTTRISTVGELTATLAHELNQPLTAILSNAQAAQRMIAHRNPEMSEILEILSDIVHEDRRANDIIHKCRELLRRSEFNFEHLDINQVIQEIIPLIKSDLLIKDISLQLDLDEHILPVRGERIQIQQVILNLIANSLDAMNKVKSKKLIIRTEQTDASSVRISVEDSGTGIDECDTEDLFAPFYTTKNDGMGMGLAISRSIINTHGGKLWAENNPGHGATFFFTIPVATEKKE